MYSHAEEGDYYAIVNDRQEIGTPMGNSLTFESEAIAIEVAGDLNPNSLVPILL